MRSERLMQKRDGKKMCVDCRKYIRVGEAIIRESLGLREWYRHAACLAAKKQQS